MCTSCGFVHENDCFVHGSDYFVHGNDCFVHGNDCFVPGNDVSRMLKSDSEWVLWCRVVHTFGQEYIL